jgi:hypothetical protein
MAHDEGPSNWLSKIIEEKRATIDRLIPFIERKAERDAIVAAIKDHPNGQPLARNPHLSDVVWAALGVANDREREAKRNPNDATASPAIQASWFIFEELELPIPEPEF